MLFKFVSDNSGYYPNGMNAGNAFRAKDCGLGGNRHILEFSVLFETRSNAVQFMNALSSYVKYDDQIFFCDQAGNETKEPGWRAVLPVNEETAKPIFQAH